MLVLGQYLNQSDLEMSLLGKVWEQELESKQIESINQGISLWLGQCSLADEDAFLIHVSLSFNLSCNPFKCHLMIQIEENNDKFISWLEKFMERNRINLPYADSFFNMILSLFLDEKEAEKFLNETDKLSCISKVKNSFCNMILNNDVFEDENEKADFMNWNQGYATKSVSASPELDFVEGMRFEPLVRSESEGIRIQLLE